MTNRAVKRMESIASCITRDGRSKFISDDEERIVIYKGSTLLAEFPNNAWGREEYNLYLYALSKVEGEGVWDCDLERNVSFLNWHNQAMKETSDE